MQERLLFLPTHLEQDYRFEFNYPFEELFLKATDGALLNGIHFKVAQPKGVILYFHGNAGDLSRWGKIAEPFVKKGYDLVMMDYRTYGKSTGTLAHDVFSTDAQLFYAYVRDHYEEHEITLYGRSLGTYMATCLASNNKPGQLILETPYYSMVDIAERRFPLFPVKHLLKYPFPSYNCIAEVTCPITIIHGTDDDIVPIASAKRLNALAPQSLTTFITIEDGKHNTLGEDERYWSYMHNILP